MAIASALNRNDPIRPTFRPLPIRKNAYATADPSTNTAPFQSADVELVSRISFTKLTTVPVTVSNNAKISRERIGLPYNNAVNMTTIVGYVNSRMRSSADEIYSRPQ